MRSSDEVLKTVSQLRFGDLCEAYWHDHSKRELRLKAKGKRRYMYFDVPVQSAGYFFGIAGEETKHIILARDVFIWPHTGDFDADAAAIMIVAISQLRVTKKGALHKRLGSKVLGDLKVAWEKGQIRVIKRGKRVRLRMNLEANNDEEHDS